MRPVRNLLAAAFTALLLTTSFASVPMLSGCTSLGIVAPQGFSERVTVGYQSITAGANLVGAYLDAGKLTAADARNAHDQLTNFKVGLDIASSIYATDQPAGEARLNATIAGIDALLAYLRSKA